MRKHRIKVAWYLTLPEGFPDDDMVSAIYDKYKEEATKILMSGFKPHFKERYQAGYNQDDFTRSRFTVMYSAFIIKVPRFLSKHLIIKLPAKAEAMKQCAINVLDSFKQRL